MVEYKGYLLKRRGQSKMDVGTHHLKQAAAKHTLSMSWKGRPSDLINRACVPPRGRESQG